MTLVYEANEIQSSGYREAYETVSITRTFVVTQSSDDPEVDDTTATITLEGARAVSTIPLLGDPHPVLGWACTNISADYSDPGSQHVVVVNAEYRQSLPNMGGEASFTNIQITPQLQYVDAWKTGVPFPANGDAGAGVEIGDGVGTCISSGATAASVAIVAGTMTITHEQTGVPLFSWLMGNAGTRNSTYFLGFNPGTLVYAGPSVRQIGSLVYSIGDPERTYEITHTFLFDQHYHLRQHIKRNTAMGVPPLNSDDGCVSNLFWRQPFPYFWDFWSFGIPGLGDL